MIFYINFFANCDLRMSQIGRCDFSFPNNNIMGIPLMQTI